MAYVIGTAGHVDHGKTSLVAALTGTDTDRLKEEKERGLTIDLGFTFIDLPLSGRTGIVDVPGHRDFIENMLAGVGGIDLALLVIAADEGVMPQTQEHLDILHLLGVQQVIVALSKIDLIDDPDWLDLVTLDVDAVLEKMGFVDWSIMPVSSMSGTGLDNLINVLDATLQQRPPPDHQRITRLPVDRVFTIDGFGTVVTGTLLGGGLSVGQIIEIQPSNLQGRIRGIQNHNQPIDSADPGNRVAINVSGIEKQNIQRGDVLTLPGQLQPTARIDAQLEYLPAQSIPLKHNSEVKFFSGAAESMARVRVIGEKEITPGSFGWAQLELSEAVAVATGDRFILRRPSPPTTIGGGIILDPHPPHQWRRFREETMAHFELLEQGSPEDRLLAEVDRAGIVSRGDLVADEALLSSIMHNGRLITLSGDYLTTDIYLNRTQSLIQNLLEDYHRMYPLYQGMSREDLRTQLALERSAFVALIAYLTEQDRIAAHNGWVFLPSHEIHFDDHQQKIIAALVSSLQENAFQTPSYAEVSAEIGEDLLQALFLRGDVVQAKNGVLFERSVYNDAVRAVRDQIEATGSITVADARDLFNTSRKYVLGLLEHLDEIGVTHRVENYRVLR